MMKRMMMVVVILQRTNVTIMMTTTTTTTVTTTMTMMMMMMMMMNDDDELTRRGLKWLANRRCIPDANNIGHLGPQYHDHLYYHYYCCQYEEGFRDDVNH